MTVQMGVRHICSAPSCGASTQTRLLLANIKRFNEAIEKSGRSRTLWDFFLLLERHKHCEINGLTGVTKIVSASVVI